MSPIPKHIRMKMNLITKYSNLMKYYSEQVNDWLNEKGFSDDYLRSGDGCSLEELEYGNDITESLCNKLEEDYREGNIS